MEWEGGLGIVQGRSSLLLVQVSRSAGSAQFAVARVGGWCCRVGEDGDSHLGGNRGGIA
jgi:hypothetical protein